MGISDPVAGDHSFEQVWATLAPRLERALRGTGVSADSRSDIVQETALRLLSRWDRVATDQDVFPLAYRIARNLSHDHARRSIRTVPIDDRDFVTPHNTEDAAFARIELGRVFEGLSRLIPRYRALLLAEAGMTTNYDHATNGALKVARSRARAKLQQYVQRMRGVLGSLAWRFRAMYRRGSQHLDLSNAWGALGTIMVASGILLFTPVPNSGTPNDWVPEPPSARGGIAYRTDHASPHEQRRDPTVHNLAAGATRRSPSRTAEPNDDPVQSALSNLPPSGSQGEDRGHIGADGYHFRQHGESHAGDAKVSWRYEHKYKTPPCVQDSTEGSPSTDCRSKKPSGYVEVERDGTKHRAEY